MSEWEQVEAKFRRYQNALNRSGRSPEFNAYIACKRLRNAMLPIPVKMVRILSRILGGES